MGCSHSGSPAMRVSSWLKAITYRAGCSHHLDSEPPQYFQYVGHSRGGAVCPFQFCVSLSGGFRAGSGFVFVAVALGGELFAASGAVLVGWALAAADTGAGEGFFA